MGTLAREQGCIRIPGTKVEIMPINFTNIMLVGAGGFLGSALRFILATWSVRASGIAVFPVGTLVVNILGCLVIGFLAGLSEGRQVFNSEIRLLIFVGILGGFTTFSAFGLDTINLIRDGRIAFGMSNVLLQIGVCLVSVWIGLLAGRNIP